MLLLEIRLLHDPEKSEIEVMKHSLDQLAAHYDLLLKDHASLHGKLFNPMRLDLGGGDESG